MFSRTWEMASQDWRLCRGWWGGALCVRGTWGTARFPTRCKGAGSVVPDGIVPGGFKSRDKEEDTYIV